MEDRKVVEKKLDRAAPFKKCPRCGKRFEVRHTSERVEKEKELVPEEKEYLEPAGVAVAYPIPTPSPETVPKTEVEEAVEKDVYEETYTCEHCGHVWTETSEKTRDLGEVNDSKGDV